MYKARFTISEETKLDTIRAIINGANADVAWTVNDYKEHTICSDQDTVTFIISELYQHYTSRLKLAVFISV